MERFFHVAVNERSRKFTSFVTHNSQYQFRRMPFGLSTCPSTFMRCINAIFRHLISKSIVLPYVDDVVIPAANELKLAHVNGLSRPPHCMLIQNSVHLQFLKAQQADDQITAIKSLLETTPDDNYIVKNKLLYKTVNGTDLLVVLDKMQANIIKTAHECDHFAVLRKQDLVSKNFYIPRLKDKVEKCIQNCVTCILTNQTLGKQDVIDAFSKITWLYPTRSTDAAEAINRLENQRLVFEKPARIITDKGSAFTSSAFEDFCNKHTKHPSYLHYNWSPKMKWPNRKTKFHHHCCAVKTFCGRS
ncbi:transposon Ty3-I Gag-Pol polyprotein [Trichonephila inaurata madagascariensis]|uniref:RNA-directed DNA polymerase n=1 Tax=Trichonephila inaurata madagascariensis TaxID=2747483 RepID=A0A8X6XNX0_9ARAC|nr:transposon Ty3-I Gag-Pol polyprotein [Trichonephila inaurata madagascariensis]